MVADGEVKIDVVELGRGQWFGYTVECHDKYQDALSKIHPTWKVVDLYSAACTLDSALMPVNVQTYVAELGKKIVATGGREAYMEARTLELATDPQDSTVLTEVNAAALASQQLVDKLTGTNPDAPRLATKRNRRRGGSKSIDTAVSPAVPSAKAQKRRASSHSQILAVVGLSSFSRNVWRSCKWRTRHWFLKRDHLPRSSPKLPRPS